MLYYYNLELTVLQIKPICSLTADLFYYNMNMKTFLFLALVALAVAKPNQLLSFPCKTCEETESAIKEVLGNVFVQDGFKLVLNSACGFIPDAMLSAACKETVTDFLPDIIKYINSDLLDDALCTDTLHCSNGKFLLAYQPTQLFSICDTLKEIYNDIPSIVDKAEGVCNAIPDAKLKQSCEDSFKNYKPEIVKMGDETVKWLAQHIPFVHCNLN